MQSTAQQALDLARLVEERVRWFLGEYPLDYLWVPVSGGKDSAAVWAAVASVTRDYVAAFIHIPGQTHADNIRAVYSVAEALGVASARVVRVGETRRIRERLAGALEGCRLPCLLHIVAYTPWGGDFWAALERYGYPAPLGRFGRGTRWCCGTFKHRVLQRLPPNCVLPGRGPWKCGANGVKPSDSPYRKRKYTGPVMTWERTRDTYLFPLYGLTDSEVWLLIEHYGLLRAVRPQYERWGRAPNCMWCPMLGRHKAERTARAMPPALRRHVRERLQALLPRYKPGTYSHRSIRMWLEVLSDGE